MDKKNIKEWIELLSGGTYGLEVELPILSGSMDPFLPAGKIALIRTLSVDDIKKLNSGAIIVYKNKFNLTAHRMIMKFPYCSYIYEKGDRNMFGTFLRIDSIVGVVYACKNEKSIIYDFFSKEQIRIANKETYKNILKVLINTAMIIPRRVKSVLEK